MGDAVVKSWHRRDDETDRAFRAFSLYLSQPPPRTLLFVRNAGYAAQSVQTWKDKYEWIQRSVDYDNFRADAILEQDVSLVSLYQQKVTEAGLEDMQLLRAMWQNAAAKLQREIENNYEASAADVIDAIDTLTKARLNVDKLSRLAARMPDTHKPLPVPEDVATFPTDIIQLSLGSGSYTMLSEGGSDPEDEQGSTEEEIITE